MKRRELISNSAVFAAMTAGLSAIGASAILQPLPATARALGPIDLPKRALAPWQAWKSVHLLSDGRVVDRLQSDASHSEGQGYGMVLAVAFADAEAFGRMYQWTERQLAVRSDPLLAWRWLPGRANPVPDRNNASDGDLFYAWALVRAGRAFNESRYLSRALEIAEALAATCVRADPRDPGRSIFLPAAFGFVHDTRVTINPSYYMPLAMREVAAATGIDALSSCAVDGLQLLSEIAPQGLVPDWVDITSAGIGPAQGQGTNAGYEALRVPLFLVWSGHGTHPVVTRFAAVYDRSIRPGESAPTVIEPLSGVVLERSPDAGYRALGGLVRCAVADLPGADIPAFTAQQPYYPATLHLFATLAANAQHPGCVPI